MELQLLFQLSNLAHKRLLLTIVNMQGWFNGGHPSETLALHWNSIKQMQLNDQI